MHALGNRDASDAGDSQLWEEVMLSAYYVGQHEIGLEACERLLGRHDHSADFYDYVGRNESFYVRNIEGLRRGRFEISPNLLERDGTTYVAMNPSVGRVGERLFVNVRLVNYRVDNNGYFPTGPEFVIRTRNVTLEWDWERERVVREQESCVVLPEGWSRGGSVRGLEDMRWVVHRDRVWFAAGCCQVPGQEERPQVVLGRMNEALDAVDHLIALRYPDSGLFEKNWLPWSRNGTLYLVYGYDPFVVLHVDPSSGEASCAFRSRPMQNTCRFRGSAGPIQIPGADRWLALVHEVAHFTNHRVYTHRFIELNRRFELVGFSQPFTFDHGGLEYAAGLCALGDDRLLVTYGWDDREARWIELSLSAVLGLLRRVV